MESRLNNSAVGIRLLRWSLAVVFIWFGALKVAGYNPVFDLIHNSMAPMLASGIGLTGLGIFECVIGLLLLCNRAILLAHLLLALHLLGTFSTFIFGWHIMFTPAFPILSLAGEFVVKNLTLVIAGLVVLVHESRRRRLLQSVLKR